MALRKIKFTRQGATAMTGNFGPGTIARVSAAFAFHLVEELGVARYDDIPEPPPAPDPAPAIAAADPEPAADAPVKKKRGPYGPRKPKKPEGE
jgi:hypothetical protein